MRCNSGSLRGIRGRPAGRVCPPGVSMRKMREGQAEGEDEGEEEGQDEGKDEG